MAQQFGALNRQPTDLNPAPVSKFRLQFQRLPNVEYTLNQANLPSLTSGVAIQNTPLARLPVPGNGNLEFGEFRIQFIVDENLNNYFEIANWMIALGFPANTDQYAALQNSDFQTNPEFKGIWSDCTLIILTNLSNPNINITFRDAFPVHLSELQFDATVAGSPPLLCTALFRYARFEFNTNV